jgi:hypothetical protein
MVGMTSAWLLTLVNANQPQVLFAIEGYVIITVSIE